MLEIVLDLSEFPSLLVQLLLEFELLCFQGFHQHLQRQLCLEGLLCLEEVVPRFFDRLLVEVRLDLVESPGLRGEQEKEKERRGSFERHVKILVVSNYKS